MRWCLIAAALALGSSVAHADTRGGPFGVGVIAGTPTGVTAQLRLGGPRLGSAFNAAIGLDTFDENGVYLHLDYVVGVLEIVRSPGATLTMYLGGGGFLRDKSNTHAGVRIPLGVELDFRRTHLSLFAEAVLRIGLAGDVDADVRGAAGLRYFF